MRVRTRPGRASTAPTTPLPTRVVNAAELQGSVQLGTELKRRREVNKDSGLPMPIAAFGLDART